MADNLTAGQVEHVAKLANLPVTTDETSQFQKQLSEIVGYVSKIEKVHSAQGIVHRAEDAGAGRKDEVKGEECLTQEEATANAKSVHNGLFVAPAVFGDK